MFQTWWAAGSLNGVARGEGPGARSGLGFGGRWCVRAGWPPAAEDRPPTGANLRKALGGLPAPPMSLAVTTSMSAPVLCVLPLQPTFLSPVLELWLLYSFPDIQHMSLGRPRPWKLLCDSDCCLLQQNLAVLWTAVPRGWVSGPVKCRPEQPGLLQCVCVGKAMVPEHKSAHTPPA